MIGQTNRQTNRDYNYIFLHGVRKKYIFSLLQPLAGIVQFYIPPKSMLKILDLLFIWSRRRGLDMHSPPFSSCKGR